MTNERPLSSFFIAGHIAGMAGVIAGAPFDMVKVKMQTFKSRPNSRFPWLQQQRRYPGAIDCARSIFNTHGSRGFYHGILPPVLAVGIQKSIAFGVFGSTKLYLQGNKTQPSMKDIAIAGGLAGLANSVILCPVDQLKIAQQVHSSSLINLTRYMMQTHSSAMRALYGTIGAVLMREIPGYALYFSTYEQLIRVASKYNQGESKVATFFAGGCAGMTMWTLYYPLDFIKSTAQARNINTKKPVSPFTIARSVYQKKGVRGFYHGIRPAVLRAFPTHACIFLVYEIVTGLFKKY